MSSSLMMATGAAAVVVFWVLGAYNRLIRLRAQALQAFTALLVPLRRRHTLAESLAARASQHPVAGAPAPPAPGGLQAAAWQFGVSLAAAQARPLHGPAMRSLGAAEAVLCAAWERHCMGQRPLPEETASTIEAAQAIEWQAIAAQQAHAAAEFERAAARYNQGLRQFPASLVASLFRLREAETWRP